MLCHHRNALLDQLLNAVEVSLLIPVTECNSDAFCPGTRGATDAVNVALWLVRNVVVDDVADVVNINAARCNVGGNQDAGLTTLEVSQGCFARVLRLVAVNRFALEASVGKLLDDLVGSVLGARKDQHAR